MAAAGSDSPTFPGDFAPCVDREDFERVDVDDLAHLIQGQYLYCHGSGVLVQIVEAEAYSETNDPIIYQAMFGSPCAQFKVKAGELVARFPTLAQTAMTPQTASTSQEPLELYITAGSDQHCGDVVRLISFLPVEGAQAFTTVETITTQIIIYIFYFFHFSFYFFIYLYIYILLFFHFIFSHIFLISDICTSCACRVVGAGGSTGPGQCGGDGDRCQGDRQGARGG
jgi:hypothetical protein